MSGKKTNNPSFHAKLMQSKVENIPIEMPPNGPTKLMTIGTPAMPISQDSGALKAARVHPLSSSKYSNRLVPSQVAPFKPKVSNVDLKASSDSLANQLANVGLESPASSRKVQRRTSNSTATQSDASGNALRASPKSDYSNDKIVLLRKQLAEAEARLARMDQEMSTSRFKQQNADQRLTSSVDHAVARHVQSFDSFQTQAANSLSPLVSHQTATHVGMNPTSAFNAPVSPWQDISKSEQPTNTVRSNPRFDNVMGAWGSQAVARPVTNNLGRIQADVAVSQRSGTASFDSMDWGTQLLPQSSGFPSDATLRRNAFNTARPDSDNGNYFAPVSHWNPYSPNASGGSNLNAAMENMPFLSSFNSASTPYQPRPIGTGLSPTALEFQATQMSSNTPYGVPAWSSQPSEGQNTDSYISPVEPLNYRRMLDKNVTCNWKYIVDKIVCSNDQQASIFLQQKLKIATPEQKFELIEAIIAQAYALMVNRFGNFLVQRCFEHGTPEQIVAIANAIRGNTLALSMDPFGCHVVQKAFDAVPEDYKAVMVHELLRNIPETVIHRYACHVWQKLFELRWSDSPPQIMKFVNEALAGMWHDVALGETGSLVVQNIFENCLEEDKRPCIEEVIANIDIVSHGQFGNWCIQHICEHGAPADKSRAIEHVLRYATEYSTDQFASKVVEKCLKVNRSDFLDRYLNRVCEGHPDRPRMPLIDIAGDQYGNYLIQYILTNAEPQQRELVAQHIRKHMVSLRGSKFGSRVAMLCSNPAFATRPGPPMSMSANSRFFPSGSPNPSMGSMGMSRHNASGGYR